MPAQMTRRRALILLQGGARGVKRWNASRLELERGGEYWRAELPSLADAELAEAELQGIKLWWANLSGANLLSANLQGADLRLANLTKANLYVANLQEARLTWANLLGAHLSLANLKGATLRGANLRGANLDHANLQGADLDHTKLQGANFALANLQGTNLEQTDLSDAILDPLGAEGRWWEDFTPPTRPFYPAPPYILDRCKVRNTTFAPRARDPWSILRRTYTGPNFAIILLLTIVAFLPAVTTVVLWSTVSQWQAAATPVAINALQDVSRTLGRFPDAPWTPWVEQVDDLATRVEARGVSMTSVRETLDLLAQSAAQIRTFREAQQQNAAALADLKGAERWVTQAQQALGVVDGDGNLKVTETRVAWIVIGWREGWVGAVLGVVLLFYNLLRFYVTRQVSSLREDEQRSDVTPAWRSYKPLWHWHQVSAWLAFIALTAFGFKLWQMLSAEVLVPGL